MTERLIITGPVVQEVEVDGVVMRVGAVSAADAVDLMDVDAGTARRDFNARLLAACVTREGGDRVGDAAYWAQQPMRIVNALARVAIRVNGMGAVAGEGDGSGNLSAGGDGSGSPSALH